MPTAGEPPTGRERRRKGLVNRVRRFLYGLLLLAAAPGATAVDELAAYGRYRVPPAAASDPAQRALATVQGLVVLRAQPASDEVGPTLELDTVTARIHGNDGELTPHFLIAAVKAGQGFDLMLADVGTLRVDLQLGGVENETAWALCGTLALDDRKATDVPAVRIHRLHANETRYLPFEVSVREAHLAFKWRA